MRRIDRIFHFVETLPASDRLILKTLAFCFLASLLVALIGASTGRTIEVPERGGKLTEGVVGTPRFINPILAVTSADRDMVMLLYSGLMRLGSDGVIAPDMAESVTISDDGLTYNILLKQGLTFHDGTPLTSDDVIFTIERIQDPALKSPLRANWEGVTLERISAQEMNIVLQQPYAPFIENLTVGILPRHIWGRATAEELPFSQHNSEPIGSGPYRIRTITHNDSGIPEAYTLTPFKGYHAESARIAEFTMKFFSNETSLVSALKEGTIDSAASLSPHALREVLQSKQGSRLQLYETPLPRTFAVFFNQNEAPLFRDPTVRRALETAIDRDRIVAEVLGGYGTPLEGPVPPGFGMSIPDESVSDGASRIELAKEILRAGGWKMNETTLQWEKETKTEKTILAFSIATANSPAFETTADMLTEMWTELGASVETKKFDQGDLTQAVIRPRKYEALLFGTAVGRELDFYSFWHSSQRNDPGLNIALYANVTTDALLSAMRTETDPEERQALYARFDAEMRKDIPAIFLYVPQFTYVAPRSTHNIRLEGITNQSERFATIQHWFVESESVWPFFTH